MLTGFSIRNFKNLEAIPANEGGLVPLPAALNVLIGPNGVWKIVPPPIDRLPESVLHVVGRALPQGTRMGLLRPSESASKPRRPSAGRLTAELGPNDSGSCAGRYHYVVTLQPRRHLGIGQEELEYTPRSAVRAYSLLSIAMEGRRLFISDRESGVDEQYQAMRLPASVMSELEGAK